MQIELKEITRENLRECCTLELDPEQAKRIAPNAISIAESKLKPGYEPYAIYNGNRMVGFIMYGHDKHEDLPGQYYLIRLMIAKNEQRNGYGRAATLIAIERMKSYRDCSYIDVGAVVGYEASLQLYLNCGFVKTGEIFGREIQLRIEVKK